MWQGRGPLIVVLSGPSGVGKTEVAQRLLQQREGIRRSVSATTRPPRPGEQDGRDYYFLSTEEFQQRIAAGRLVEWARYGDHWYGTPREEMERARASGVDLLLVIEVQGAVQIRARYPQAVLIFLLPPDWQTLEGRLRRRGTDSPEAIQRRLARAREELQIAPLYDYCVVNEEGRPDQAAGTIQSILTAERYRLTALAAHRLASISREVSGFQQEEAE